MARSRNNDSRILPSKHAVVVLLVQLLLLQQLPLGSYCVGVGGVEARSFSPSLRSSSYHLFIRGGGGDGSITDNTDTNTNADNADSSKSTAKKVVLRIRLVDGSVERMEIDETKIDALTLLDVLKPFDTNLSSPSSSSSSSRVSVRIDNNKQVISSSSSLSLKDINIKHGSIITIVPSSTIIAAASSSKDTTSRFSTHTKKKTKYTSSSMGDDNDWDPYPDLAKDYDELIYKSKRKRSSRTSLSYSDISKIQSALHVVEPQKTGPVERIYMCRVSAERFCLNGMNKAKMKQQTLSSSKKKKESQQQYYDCRIGLLFGTIHKERVDKNELDRHRRKNIARTSLSSQTSDSEYCMAAKVQAVWEPSNQQPVSDTLYDTNLAHHQLLLDNDEGSSSSSSSSGVDDDTVIDSSQSKQSKLQSQSQSQRALLLAKYLDLKPIGWIFSYNDERLKEKRDKKDDGNEQNNNPKQQQNEPQALFGLDVAIAGKLKSQNMKIMTKTSSTRTTTPITNKNDNSDSSSSYDTGNEFVTLAMDATTGATEAFQLSDVAVQMIHEDMFEKVLSVTNTKSNNNNNKNPPIVPMRHEIIVDGQETKLLDSVLCLVNTAMLSHIGAYSGASGGGTTTTATAMIKKSNGTLTNKAKRMLLKALQQQQKQDAAVAAAGDGKFLELLCDFNVLLGLDRLLMTSSSLSPNKHNTNDNDIKTVCSLVKKWSRGQKQTTKIDSKLKRKLMTYLE